MDFVGKSPVPRDQHTMERLAHFLKTVHQVTPTKDMGHHFDLFEIIQNLLQFLQDKNLPKESLNNFTKVLEFKKHQALRT